MESQRILEKIAFLSMGLCILILAGLSIFQYQQIRKLSKNVSQDIITGDDPTADFISDRSETAHQNPTKGTTLAGNKNESAADEINDLEFQLKAVEEELDITHKQLLDEISRQEELREKEKRQDEDWKNNSLRRETILMRIEDEYAERLTEREIINAFNESLNSSGDNLSDAQEKQLIDAMYKERNDAFSIFSDEPYSYKI